MLCYLIMHPIYAYWFSFYYYLIALKTDAAYTIQWRYGKSCTGIYDKAKFVLFFTGHTRLSYMVLYRIVAKISSSITVIIFIHPCNWWDIVHITSTEQATGKANRCKPVFYFIRLVHHIFATTLDVEKPFRPFVCVGRYRLLVVTICKHIDLSKP